MLGKMPAWLLTACARLHSFSALLHGCRNRLGMGIHPKDLYGWPLSSTKGVSAVYLVSLVLAEVNTGPDQRDLGV